MIFKEKSVSILPKYVVAFIIPDKSEGKEISISPNSFSILYKVDIFLILLISILPFLFLMYKSPKILLILTEPKELSILILPSISNNFILQLLD